MVLVLKGGPTMTVPTTVQGPSDRRSPLAAQADEPPFGRFPWLTQRHLIFFVIGWLVLFALGSLVIANPFQSEANAAATPDYWRVMYLHGLLIGMVGLLAVLTCSVLQLTSRHTRSWIVGGVLFATIVTAIGGIWDRQIPGAEVAMWVQILGFFALDEILIALLAGMVIDWRARTPVSRTLPFWAAGFGAASMLVAALMGHLAGWILEFGNNPGVIGAYASSVGLSLDDFTANLIGSHSHEMVVGVMALTVAIAVRQFGYDRLAAGARAIAKVGLTMVAVGAVAMTVMYVAMGFTTFDPGMYFTSADGTNGIAGDDIVTGVLVMTGGLIALLSYLFVARDRSWSLLGRPVRFAALWSWLLSFVTVVVAGYAIELDEVQFGAGGAAPSAANDAVYTWLHQDIGLFLLPALVLVMLVVDRFIAPRYQNWIGWTAIIGSTVTFIGGLVFVFVNPALHGPGYDLSTIGLLVVGLALLGTMWWGVFHTLTRPLPTAPPAHHPA
jgi:hypothetical protein